MPKKRPFCVFFLSFCEPNIYMFFFNPLCSFLPRLLLIYIMLLSICGLVAMGQKLNGHSGKHPPDLVQMNPEPIQ